MFYVYLIQSIPFPDRMYVGYTINLKQRFERHNAGGSVYTAPFKPWSLVTVVRFNDMQKAKSFEAYLKTYSGKAFAKKRLW